MGFATHAPTFESMRRLDFVDRLSKLQPAERANMCCWLDMY